MIVCSEHHYIVAIVTEMNINKWRNIAHIGSPSVKLCGLVISFYDGNSEQRLVLLGLPNHNISLLACIYMSDFVCLGSVSCLDGLISLDTLVGGGACVHVAKLNQSKSCSLCLFPHLLLS